VSKPSGCRVMEDRSNGLYVSRSNLNGIAAPSASRTTPMC
jgi:hypothetical protein